LQSVIAGHVPPNEQGELQGALTSLMSLTTIIGPPIMNNIFYQFTKKNAPIHFPGAFFLLAGVIMLVSLVITFDVLRREKRENPALPQLIDGPAESSAPGSR
jgi:DHA1 family tetracycline resistance protein-like MFS transporter